MWKFPDQGSNLSYSSDNARSLTTRPLENSWPQPVKQASPPHPFLSLPHRGRSRGQAYLQGCVLSSGRAGGAPTISLMFAVAVAIRITSLRSAVSKHFLWLLRGLQGGSRLTSQSLILQMRKVRHREAKELVQGHTAGVCRAQETQKSCP